jgi:hypothetical protein
MASYHLLWKIRRQIVGQLESAPPEKLAGLMTSLRMKLNGPRWSRAVGHMGNVGLDPDVKSQTSEVRTASLACPGFPGGY